MNIEITIIMLASLLFILIAFYIVRLFTSLQKKKLADDNKNTSQVGFVVDTFHDLVIKLKDKEKELEALRRRAEERASSVEIYNENIFQSVPSGVVSFDQDLLVTKFNSAAARILTLKENVGIGQKHTEVFNPPITDLLEQGKTIERAEFSYVTHGGKRIWLGLTISPLKDSAHAVIGQILVFTDLTELKAFQSQVELRERLSTLGEMSAGIAHELRNPMAVISGYTKILSKKVDPVLLPAVESISKEVAGMDRIISDFLSFAKPTELILSTVNLRDLVSGCIQSLADISGKAHIYLKDNSMPMVKVDEILLRQAIANLLQNAVESVSEGGHVTVDITVGDYLVVNISDTGHGIPENIRDKIFLPFYTTKERGTGLGLSIVHKIIISHGGTIQVQSGEKGSTFSLRLPREVIVDAG